jgi:hypothetical protein
MYTMPVFCAVLVVVLFVASRTADADARTAHGGAA